jgi:hypothetical protein
MIALFRVIGGIIMLIGIYFFLDFFVVRREKRNVFLMLLFAQPLPFALNVMQEWFGKWTWHFGEAARRISAMPPHYTVGKGLVLISLFLFFLSQKKQSKKILFVAGSILIIGGIIYPPPLFILLVSMLLSGLFYCIVERERVKNIAIIKGAPFCFYLLACILPLIFLKIELSKGFPWYMWNKVELGWNDPKMMFEWEYARMLGGYLFLLPIAFIIFMREKKKKWQDYFLWVWCMSAFLLFPFANALQLGKFRFTEGIQIVPLSILGWYGIRRLPGVIIKILLILIICNFILFSGLKTYESTESLWITWSNVYIVKEEQEVLGYLNTNAQQSEVVLADKFASNYLPAFARVKTILGFSDLYENFWDFQLEEKTTASILKGELPQEEAKSYLEKKNIKFIYYQSFSYGHKPLYPSLMEKAYGNQFYEIYRVK